MMPEESESPLHERESGMTFRDSSIPNHPSFSLASYTGIRASNVGVNPAGNNGNPDGNTNNNLVKPVAINISFVHGTSTAHAIHEMDQKEKLKRHEDERQRGNKTTNKEKSEENDDAEREYKSHHQQKPISVIGPGGNVDMNSKKATTVREKATSSLFPRSLSSIHEHVSRYMGTYYNRPLLLLSGSVFLAWVYTMIPTTNYWIYYLVKSQWWVVLTLITYIEIQFVNIPDLSDTSYIVMYIGGFLIAPTTHIVRWALNADNNFTISSLSVLFSFIVVVIVSGIDCFLSPKSVGERRAISSASTSSTMFLAAATMARNNSTASGTNNGSSPSATSMALSYSPMFLATRMSLLQFGTATNPAFNTADKLESGQGTVAGSSEDNGIEPHYNRASVSFAIPQQEQPSKGLPQHSRTISVSPMTSRLASMESNTNRIANHLLSVEVELQSSQSGNSSSGAASKIYREFSSIGGSAGLSSVRGTDAGTGSGSGSGLGTIPSSTHKVTMTSTDTLGSSESNLVSVNLRESEYQRNSLFFRKKYQENVCSSFCYSSPITYYCFGGFLLNIDNYWFLPRYWNIDYSHLINTLKPQTDRRILWLFTCCFNLFYSIYYVFLIYFTEYFRHERKAFSLHNTDDDTHDSESVRDDNQGLNHIYLFLFYIVCNTFLRITLKSIGMYLDKQKECSISMYFIAEVMSLFFYYTFYRVLFESITSILEFLLFQVLHLCSEWILYIGRCTNMYYVITEYCLQTYLPSSLLQQPRLSHRSWQVFITLDFGIRCAVLVVTGYGMLLLLTTIQFVPYLKPHNDLTQSNYDYSFTAVLIAIAIVFELCNAGVMIYVYFKPQNLEVMEEVRHCFSLPHFALLAMMIGANLFVNPIFAFTTGVSGLKG